MRGALRRLICCHLLASEFGLHCGKLALRKLLRLLQPGK
jgi:hypothetical protein